MQILTGHTSADTAHVAERFPYAFGVTTRKRFWVETRPTLGQRVVTQTLNPHTGDWNRPKATRYEAIAVLYQIDSRTFAATLSHAAAPDQVEAFAEIWADGLTGDYERETLARLRDRSQAVASA